jgi:hypothetical protein
MKRRLIESVFKLAIDEATRKDTKGRRVENGPAPSSSETRVCWVWWQQRQNVLAFSQPDWTVESVRLCQHRDWCMKLCGRLVLFLFNSPICYLGRVSSFFGAGSLLCSDVRSRTWLWSFDASPALNARLGSVEQGGSNLSRPTHYSMSMRHLCRKKPQTKGGYLRFFCDFNP